MKNRILKLMVALTMTAPFAVLADMHTHPNGDANNNTYSNDNANNNTHSNDKANNKNMSTMDSMGEHLSETAITTKVKSAFLQEKLFGDAAIDAFSISVETKDGVVHLTGTAENQVQADNAVKIAKGIDGVKEVVSDIKIQAHTE